MVWNEGHRVAAVHANRLLPVINLIPEAAELNGNSKMFLYYDAIFITFRYFVNKKLTFLKKYQV